MSVVRRFHRSPKRGATRSLVVDAVIVFVLVLVAALLTGVPRETVTDAVSQLAPKVAVDQRFSSCADARAAGRQNIPSWDPSYRARMDRDGDGLACEPYR
jgi:hypothetical protein